MYWLAVVENVFITPLTGGLGTISNFASIGITRSSGKTYDFDETKFGEALAAAGDVDGDGYDDVIVGAIYGDPHGADSGESYVIYGGSSLGSIMEVPRVGE